MSKQLYNLPMWFVDWVIASKPNIKGQLGPPLPDGGGQARFYYGRIPVTRALQDVIGGESRGGGRGRDGREPRG